MVKIPNLFLYNQFKNPKYHIYVFQYGFIAQIIAQQIIDNKIPTKYYMIKNDGSVYLSHGGKTEYAGHLDVIKDGDELKCFFTDGEPETEHERIIFSFDNTRAIELKEHKN